MPPTSPLRYLAPVALVVVVVAVLLVGRSGSDDGDPVTTATTAAQTTPDRPSRRSYTVRPGDNLSAIAVRFGLTLEELRDLNPRLDPQTLRDGQRVRLRR
ncbi:MAG: LysM domain-containing protein [Solirubrobacteraceae bacterium]